MSIYLPSCIFEIKTGPRVRAEAESKETLQKKTLKIGKKELLLLLKALKGLLANLLFFVFKKEFI